MYCVKALLLCYLINEIDANGSRRGKVRRTNKSDADPFRGLFLIPLVLGLVIIPPILFFLYNVYRDPATPTLIKNIGEIISERTFGYLGKQNRRKKRT